MLFPLLRPVWFNVILMLLSWGIAGVAYQSNDDLIIANILDGWGAPEYADPHVIFVNPLLTRLLMTLSPLLCGVPVWGVFLTVTTFCSATIIFTILTSPFRKVTHYGLNATALLLLWLLIMPGFYSALQFSHAAFLASFAGVLVCLKYGENSWVKLTLGVLLCLLGSMIRLDAGLVCFAFWGAGMVGACMNGMRFNLQKACEKARFWLALACVTVCAFGLNEYNKYAHRSVYEGCDIAAWNQARAKLSDTSPIRPPKDYECGKYGVFANDIEMVRTFTNCDMDLFNTAYLEQLHRARDGAEWVPQLSARIRKALTLFSWNAIADLLPCWILFGLVCYISRRRGEPKAVTVCVGGILLLTLLYMASIDRLYFRVVYPTFLVAGLSLLWTRKYRPVRFSRSMKSLITWGAAVLIAGVFALEDACAVVENAHTDSYAPEHGRRLCERIDREPDALFCVQLSGETIDDVAPDQSVFRRAWSCSRKNVITLGGWNYPLKPVQEKLKHMGWQGQPALNLCRDKVYIVCLIPDGEVTGMDKIFFTMLTRHLKDHYGVSVTSQLDENLGGIRIYRLRKTTVDAGL